MNIKDLLKQELDEKILAELKSFCYSKRDESPTVFFVLDII